MHSKITFVGIFVLGVAVGVMGNYVRSNWDAELNRKFSSDQLSISYKINADDQNAEKFADDSLNMCFYIVSGNLQLHGEAGKILIKLLWVQKQAYRITTALIYRRFYLLEFIWYNKKRKNIVRTTKNSISVNFFFF